MKLFQKTRCRWIFPVAFGWKRSESSVFGTIPAPLLKNSRVVDVHVLGVRARVAEHVLERLVVVDLGPLGVRLRRRLADVERRVARVPSPSTG